MRRLLNKKFLTRFFLLCIDFAEDFLGERIFIKTNEEEGHMKGKILSVAVFAFLVLSLAGGAHSWQGRMAGIGDPFGLVADESDFLIHPSKIAKGEGIKFYGHYRFNWRDVTDWDYTLSTFRPTMASLGTNWPFRGSGDGFDHDALAGAAFPLGPGRMGLFFQYAGKRGDFDGKTNEYYYGGRYFHTYSMDSDFDSFAMRLLYGLPLGGFKVGGEIALAYRREENETFNSEDEHATHLWRKNFPFGADTPWINLFPFMFPYESKYWEALFKGSLNGAVGPAKVAFTLRGGFIFAGDNNLDYSVATVPIPSMGAIDMDGDVKGWRMGGEFWLRYPLSKGLSLPFVVRVDYEKKTRDGNGLGLGPGFIGLSYDYKNRERLFQVETGGGLDKELNKGTRVAAGIYYNYIKERSDFVLHELYPIPGFFVDYDHNPYPNQREHRVILRLAGEKELCPVVAMRMGLNFFYGWVKEDFTFDLAPTFGLSSVQKSSLDGDHWGIGASLGATVKFPGFSLEPFVSGGYQKFDVDGDGFGTSWGLLEMDRLKKEWSIGGGFSIKF
jgi:hypothetical protein